MNRKIEIHKDEKYTIVVCQDFWKQTVVQLCAIYPKSAMNHEGKLIEDRGVQLVWDKKIEMIKFDPKKNIQPVDPTEFRKEVLQAIQEAKHQLSQLERIDNMFAGLENDIRSQMSGAAKNQQA